MLSSQISGFLPSLVSPPLIKCASPLGDVPHVHSDSYHPTARAEAPLPPSVVGVSDKLRDEVVSLTQSVVQVNSGPDNLVAGENEVVTRLVAYAKEAGLDSQRFETVNGKPMLIITLPGTDPKAGSVGFVHHSDVVPPEGEWKMGAPYSGAIVNDEMGRLSMVGRGTIDTKGPAVQVLVAMKHLKETGSVPKETVKLFVFPDEETGSKDGAWLLSRKQPELFKDIKHWIVEGSGVFAPEFLAGMLGEKDVPYLAVAQKYTIPMQMELKNPTSADEAVHKTIDALDRADKYIEKRDWSYLGDPKETKEAMKRMGKAMGGFKGFLVRHLYKTHLMQKRMGTGNAAANRSDFCKTDFFLSNNSSGQTEGPNVKPSSASMILNLDLVGLEREQALERMRKAAGKDMQVTQLEGQAVKLSLPQQNYHGGNHGSTADRANDAVDVTARALKNIEKDFGSHGLAGKLKVVDVFTSKSQHEPSAAADKVSSKVTLDLRIAVGEEPNKVIADLQQQVGSEFTIRPLAGPEQMDAHVRRLSHKSPLFQAAESSIKNVYGKDTNVLFGNTTASNDTRFLMDINPECDALTFVPVLYPRHGAHGPDEAVTINSLKQGVDWIVDVLQRLGDK